VKNLKEKDSNVEAKTPSITAGNKMQPKNISPKSQKLENDYKNSTAPLKKIKEIGELSDTHQLRREKFNSEGVCTNKQENHPLKTEHPVNFK
jgi:hypothetical protein